MLDLVTGDVLGLHFGGRYAVANHAVPASELAGDGRVIDAGLAFAGEPTCAARPGASAGPRSTPALPEHPSIRNRTPSDGRSRILDDPHHRPDRAVDLDRDVQTGGGAVQVVAGPAEPAAAPRTDEPRTAGPQAAGLGTERAVEAAHDTDYTNRRGYDPTFLGTDVAPPTALDPLVLCVPRGGGSLLRCHHFSIAMHRRRRLPLFTASNVTAEAALKRPEIRPDADYTRRGRGSLGKNDRERWFGDPRIRADEQLPDRFFEQDRSSFDKGHVVRREDVSWGQTSAEMRAANGDTFHVTNCTPQISAFNQAQAKTGRLAVFADRVYRQPQNDWRRYFGKGVWYPEIKFNYKFFAGLI